MLTALERLKMYHFNSKWLVITEVYLEMEFDRSSFEVSCLVHPSTYLNKVLFGSRQGLLKLWNIHSNKHIYTFPGWGDPVTVVEQVRTNKNRLF